MRDPALTEDELATALAALPGWSVVGGKLASSRDLPSFLEGIGFVQAVGAIAEELDHHPDIDVRWRTVRLAVNTHDSGGAITNRDIELARRVNALSLETA
jgi:4a-hydroxytetrahydrobiopterin dehydratase